jgi:hypothetical protein
MSLVALEDPATESNPAECSCQQGLISHGELPPHGLKVDALRLSPSEFGQRRT